jgi:uncharacterized membrane protein
VIKSVAEDDGRRYRLTSIDMLRGLAIVVMAIDHIRDYCLVNATQDPMADPNIAPSLFLTRWITHYCAPLFTLLAGTSAGLMAARKNRVELGKFLFTRGLWLVFVEVTLMATAFSFSPQGIPQFGGHTFVILQTIWAIGASMIVLAGMQGLGRRACLVIGIAIVAGHNVLDFYWPASKLMDPSPIWVGLHAQMSRVVGPFLVLNAYPLLPWIGVMLVGFGSSSVFKLPPARRDVVLRWAGLAMTAAFIAIRAFDVYGDTNHWQAQPGGIVATVMDFLNTTKYPPSLLFLLMTLGPAAIVLSYADRITNGPLAAIKRSLVMFGRVPFAFYVAHFYLIHTLAMIIGVIEGFAPKQFATVFILFPHGYGVPLWGVYALWALVIAILYPFCRWVAEVKRRRRDWWLSYL